jgi:hypothetical protein
LPPFLSHISFDLYKRSITDPNRLSGFGVVLGMPAKIISAQSNLTDVNGVRAGRPSPVLLFAQSGLDSQGSIRERSRSQKFHQGRFVASPCLCAGSVFSVSSVTENRRSPSIYPSRVSIGTTPVPNQYREIVSIDRFAESFAQTSRLVLSLV